jgi:hypothetical protein
MLSKGRHSPHFSSVLHIQNQSAEDAIYSSTIMHQMHPSTWGSSPFFFYSSRERIEIEIEGLAVLEGLKILLKFCKLFNQAFQNHLIQMLFVLKPMMYF